MNELTRELINTSAITFEGLTKQMVLLQIDNFNQQNGTEVVRVVFKDVPNGYKAYVKFKEVK